MRLDYLILRMSDSLCGFRDEIKIPEQNWGRFEVFFTQTDIR